MSLGEHAMIGGLISFLGPYQRWGWKGTLVLVLAAIAPDLDTCIGWFADEETYNRLHRGVTHNVFSITLLSLLLACIGRYALGLRGVVAMFLWSLLACIAHDGTDMIYAVRNIPADELVVRPFWPFSMQGLSYPLLRFGDLIPLGLLMIPCFWVWRRPQDGRIVAAVSLSCLCLYVGYRAFFLPDPSGWKDWVMGLWLEKLYYALFAPGLT